MATAVLPLQNLTLDGGIMPPSPISNNFSRHGRSRHGGSVAKGKQSRGRGYSVVDERETLILKALSWVLKRTVEEDEEQEEGESEKLVADKEGWVDCEEVLAQPHLTTLSVTFPELQSFIASPASKSRFALKPKSTTTSLPSEDDELPASAFLIRASSTTSANAPPSPTTASKLVPLTSTSPSLPDLLVYETSYANYPLILASGSIKRAGGQTHLSFTSIHIAADGSETRDTASNSSGDADVSIYIDVRAAMAAAPEVVWLRAESGAVSASASAVVTEGDANGALEKRLWKKVVARRADIGVLFEDGVVKKEVPVGLRGKNVKGKRGGGKGKGRGLKELKGRGSGDEEGTGSD